MITLRRAGERLHRHRGAQEVWLTFDPRELPGSPDPAAPAAQADPAGLADPLAKGFGALEALDEIHLPPRAVSLFHPGPAVEVITYVLAGTLTQYEGTRRTGIIRTGEFHHMASGQRVHQREENASQTDWAHVMRLCLGAVGPGLASVPKQKWFSLAQRRGILCLIASPDGREGSLHTHHDSLLFSTILDVGQHPIHELARGRSAWLQVVRGAATLGALVLLKGDGVGVTGEPAVSFTALEESELLLLNLRDGRSA